MEDPNSGNIVLYCFMTEHLFPLFTFHIKETQSSTVSNVWCSNKYKMVCVEIKKNRWVGLGVGRRQLDETSTIMARRRQNEHSFSHKKSGWELRRRTQKPSRRREHADMSWKHWNKRWSCSTGSDAKVQGCWFTGVRRLWCTPRRPLASSEKSRVAVREAPCMERFR